MNTFAETIHSEEDPLPLVSTDGGPAGFIAPFDKIAFDAQAASESMNYTAGINFAWIQLLANLTSFVPIYRNRVVELARDMYPNRVPSKAMELVTVICTFERGDQLTRGSLLPVSVAYSDGFCYC